jgi:hypothetical protein
MAAMADVILYSRPRCGLCDRAREVVLEVRASAPFSFREVNVETDEDLEDRYGLRVPVVSIDGEDRFEVEVDARRLAELVRV